MQRMSMSQAPAPVPFNQYRMQGDFDVLQRRDASDEPDAKRHQLMQTRLPPPLTDQTISQALRELHQGTARAVESCLQCYAAKRMSSDDLVSFIRSIAMHSPTLMALFNEKPAEEEVHMGEAASADDFAALLAMSSQPVAQRHVPTHVAAPPSQPASNPVPAICVEPARAPAAKPVFARTRKAKVSEPSDEEIRLMKWWSEKRVPEIARRQHETAGCHKFPTAADKNSGYVRFLMGKLTQVLPTAGGLKLLQIVRSFNDDNNIEAFSEKVKELVDEFDVKVKLTHAPECTVRTPPRARGAPKAPVEVAVPSIDIDGGDLSMADDGDMGWPAVTGAAAGHVHDMSCCGGHAATCAGKRKRTETLNGAHPEDDDEGAACPVCKDEPREDDRWVKCDGCGSWYHQICVLFNEIAHGKSVRFFCRTPGCRKRGSRQLNRRQRKPCYPTSPSIESSTLADAMSELVQPMARSDRDVVIKMVANVESVREIKGSRSCRKSMERVRNKTICAFQHTLIGSDLLFLVMFVEEVVGPDGVGRVEIKKVENNGFYEEARQNEAIEVEMAIVQAYLSRASNAGFSSARIHVNGQKRSLFLGMPAAPVPSSTSSLAACTELLREARAAGIVHAFLEERGEIGESVVRAHLLPSGAAPGVVAQERDADIACPVAQTAQDWVQVQKQNGYKFEDLQFAKFSSMMLVYHLIKGWRKEFTAPSRQPVTLDYDSDDTSDTPSPARGPAAQAAMSESCDSAVPSPFFSANDANAPRMPPMATEPIMAAAPYAATSCGVPRHSVAHVRSPMTFPMDSLPCDVRCMLEAPVEPLGARGGYLNDTVPPPPASPQQVHQDAGNLLRSVLEAGTGEDTFWSDALFTEERETTSEQEESPFWDCFFSTL